MSTENLLKRITINPKVMVGKPTISGMRITVEQILRGLAGGVTVKDLLQDYPELEQEDIQAVFAYAVNLVDEEQLPFLQAKRSSRPLGRSYSETLL